MAGTIRLTTEEMRERASQFQQKSDQLTDFIGDMDSLVLQTLEDWEGEASKSFDTQWHDVKPTYTASAEALATMSQQIITTANNMEETDQAASNGIGIA